MTFLGISDNRIDLAPHERIKCEPGAMLACNNVTVETAAPYKSYYDRLKSYLFTGEGWFTNIFTANEKGGWLLLERQMPGKLVVEELTHDKPGWVVARSALVAATPNIDIQVKYKGFVGIMKGEGIATSLAKLAHDSQSPGRIYFNSGKGTAQAILLNKTDGPVIVDNDHIIAYTEGMTATLKKLGNMKSFFFSGEGFVCEFQGEGVIYLDSGAGTGSGNHKASIGEEMYPYALLAAGLAVSLIAVAVFDSPKAALGILSRALKSSLEERLS